MADWSQLPPELVTLIAKCLDTRFDVLRFRSVCHSWRSSIPPKLYPIPIDLPSQTITLQPGVRSYTVKYSPMDIMIDTLFLVKSPTTAACRVVNVREYTNCARRRRGLLKPLLDYEVPSKVLDLTNFKVIELGHQFVVQYGGQRYKLHNYELIEKAAFLWSNSTQNTNDFMMLTLVYRRRLYVVSSKSGKTESIILETGDVLFQDIISFNGKFYAIDEYGKTTVVDQSLKLSFIQHLGSPLATRRVSTKRRMLLVESGDNLLAVEMINELVYFRIFRLNEEEQKWDEIESLGDQILFLGVRQSVSASASQFINWGKGNLIFYSALLRDPYRYDDSEYEDLRVFDLDTYATGSLEIFPEYYKLFWPPPEVDPKLKEPRWFRSYEDDNNRRYRKPGLLNSNSH